MSKDKNDQINRRNKMLFLNAGKYFHDLQVIGIYMYLRDDSYGASWNDQVFLYDIVLTDCKSKLKCFLEPKTYSLIQTGKLVVGTKIRVKKANVKGNCAVLEDFVVSGVAPTPVTISNLPFYLPHNNREITAVPLCARRSYYLNPLLTTVPYGPQWSQPIKSLTSEKSTVCLARCTLRDLENRFNSTKPQDKKRQFYPQIVVRVLQRGKFTNFGKAGLSNPNPFRGVFLFGDHTALCGAVLWGQRNVGTYSHINPGDTMLIENYTVEESYMYKRLRHRFEKPFIIPLEIKLNERSIINFVAVSKYWFALPVPVYELVSRRLLGSLHHGMKVDVIGYVVYVSHSLRERVHDLLAPKEQFCAYRWIEILDDTSPLPIRIKLYLDQQWEAQEKIMPGQLLICTYMRVIRYSAAYSHDPVQLFLKSSSESIVFSKLPKHITKETRVQDFLRWVQNFQSKIEMDLQIWTCRVGGLVQPQNVQLAKLNKLKRKFRQKKWHAVRRSKRWCKLLSGKEWINAFQNLDIRERRSIIISGSVVEVSYLRVERSQILSENLFQGSSDANQNLGNVHYTLAFPRLYFPDLRDNLLRFLQLPTFSSDVCCNPITQTELNTLPFFPTDAYRVIIQSDDLQATMTTVFFPKAARSPFPSLENFLKKKYMTREFSTDSEMNIELASIHLKQNARLKKTAHGIASKDFTFKVDLVQYQVDQIVAVLQAAIVDKKGISHR